MATSIFKDVGAARRVDWKLALRKADRQPAPSFPKARRVARVQAPPLSILERLRLKRMKMEDQEDSKLSAQKRHRLRVEAMRDYGMSKEPFVSQTG